MVESLQFNVTFSTGKTLKDQHVFKDGLTLITGPNESGKSLRLELIRYALFGASCLRTKSANYKSLNVELIFKVKEDKYKVVRTLNKAVLFKNDEQLVVGAMPVTKEVQRILGVNKEIFDLVSCINQGEIEKFSNLSSSERKKTMDHFLGFSCVDKMIKDKAQKISEVRQQISKLQTFMPAEKLEDPCPEFSTETLETLSRIRMEYDLLIKNPPVVIQEPSDPYPGYTVEQLMDIKNKLDKKAWLMNKLKKCRDVGYSPAFIKEQLQRASIWKEYDSIPYTVEQLKAKLKWIEYHELCNELDQLVKRGKHVCPKCSHEWYVKQEEISNITKKLEKPDVEEIPGRVNVNHYLKIKMNPPGVERPSNNFTEQDYLDALEFENNKKLTEELEALDIDFDGDICKILNEKIKYEQDLVQHNTSKKVYEKWVSRKNDLESEIDLNIDYKTLLSDKLKYENYKVHVDKILPEIEAKKVELVELEAIKKSLEELKVKLKTELFPSLSYVSSALLNSLSDGEKAKITLGDDFEITVDGQDIDTLSGSAKAIANLAIRIAIGKTLLSKSFPVLLADEIDAAMDENRAKAVISTLSLLTKDFAQIIYVSHKSLEANSTICLQKR